MHVQEDHVDSILYELWWEPLLEISGSGAGHPHLHQRFLDAVIQALEGAASVLECLQVHIEVTFFWHDSV